MDAWILEVGQVLNSEDSGGGGGGEGGEGEGGGRGVSGGEGEGEGESRQASKHYTDHDRYGLYTERQQGTADCKLRFLMG